ncbi:uncharacterized protein LOC125701304 isoform X1 [Lagopus muta]|uniref:uncharacterized protein LOC125701304 isoform X1 n=1 Tax=Lagopus muta TaxID=64668 RepID=UPI00209F8C65|nr:uncharacterized protein LOC125701304 isoform X1 [Lagopus muta]
MLSSQQHSILTIKDLLDNGFVTGASGHTHFSPVCSYYLNSSSAPKQSAWELLADADTMRGSPVCMVAQPMDSGVRAGLSSSDLSFLSFCRSPFGPAVFDLPAVPCELPAGPGCLLDMTSRNTSTPCKARRSLQERALSHSTELLSDLLSPGKPPAARWEISEIKPPLDTSLPLDMSFLGCSKPDISPLGTPVVLPVSWPRRHVALSHEAQLGDTELGSVLLHQAP